MPRLTPTGASKPAATGRRATRQRPPRWDSEEVYLCRYPISHYPRLMLMGFDHVGVAMLHHLADPAVLEYARLGSRRQAHPCRACAGPCQAACPHRLAVRERLVRYHDLLMA